MELVKRFIILVMMSLLLVSCTDEQDTLEELQEKEEVGKQELIKISRYERNMVYFSYSSGLSTIKNGVLTTEYKISARKEIKTRINAATAKNELRTYRRMVGTFLSNYPASQFIISNREELKTKRSLAARMISRINVMQFKSQLDSKGNEDLNEIFNIENEMKHIGFIKKGNTIQVDVKNQLDTSFKITEALDEMRIFIESAELFLNNYPKSLYIYDHEIIELKIRLGKKVITALEEL